jgi:SAM-dependent methyltransferase
MDRLQRGLVPIARMPDFSTRDPNRPDFWDERFAAQFTPWDRQGVPERLRQFALDQQRPLTTLIPGCGSAYELDLLSALGWPVTAIDISAVAVERARSAFPAWADRVELADFFAWTPAAPLDLIYERAFLCALPRERWPAIVERWAALLAPGALLAGYFFFDPQPKGPPFGADPAALEALLSRHFTRLSDEAVQDSIPVFAGKERWQVWKR